MSTSDVTPTGQATTSTSPRPTGPGAQRPGAQPTVVQPAVAPPSGAQAAGARPQQAAGARAASDIRPEAPRKGQPPRKAPAKKSTRPAAGAPRRVRLTVARVDPWSVMKLAFLLSVAMGIALVVAAGVLWTVLDGMGVFDNVNDVVAEMLGSGKFDINDYVGFSKVLSLGTVLAVVNVVLLTALSTLGAFLYNISANLVGGLHTTLSDD